MPNSKLDQCDKPNTERVTTDHGFDIKEFIQQLTEKPGVYKMISQSGKIIYVGKAKNLKKRVSTYFNRLEAHSKTRAMVAQISRVETTVTSSEKEALLLENNLIKALRPRYNIVLRDDKSYPYVYLNSQHDYPRLSFHRGAKSTEGRYFGPYPGAKAVRQTLGILQKLFLIRQCEDSFFRNRSRPCLQYQIKRCTAPCMELISKPHYAEDLRLASLFLEGKNSEIMDELAHKMEQASEQLQYEKAALIRDQIHSLRGIQENQCISTEGGDLDIVACVAKESLSCVQVFFIRGGRSLGNKSFYPKQSKPETENEILSAFLTQYYVTDRYTKALPDEIVINRDVDDLPLLQQILTEQQGKRIVIRARVRADRARWLKMAQDNAELSLANRLSSQSNLLARFEALQDALGLENLPQRLECFDISHTMGEATVASCVVMGLEGFIKSDFRRFNIKGITPGDDYAAMHQALTRRYTRLKKGEGVLPDILLIDGGAGQTTEANNVLQELQIEGVIILGVAKGPSRKPGMETLLLNDCKQPFVIPAESPALHLIQQVRDEAHRFAITAHRNRRAKKRRTSSLEEIAGLGPKRRKSLLTRFGGLQDVSQANVEELAKVNGISQQLAKKIYAHFHREESE